MKISTEAITWLKGSKFGYTYKDKIILFLYILNAIIVIIFVISIFGKRKAIEIYFKRTYLVNWIPVKSVLAKKDGIMLSLPMILDYIILLKSNWEEKEREFVTKLNLNDSNAIIIDVGANIGIYTILLACVYPKAKVIAIEASQTIFDKLKSNCELNNNVLVASHIMLINKAVSDVDDKTVELYDEHSMSTILEEFLIRLIFSNDEQQLNRNIVRTITIDNLVATVGLNEISLLKLDVEGAEVLALKGAIHTLNQKKIKNMLIEYHSVENYNCIIKLLQELGYVVVVSSQEQYQISTNTEYINGHIIATLSK